MLSRAKQRGARPEDDAGGAEWSVFISLPGLEDVFAGNGRSRKVTLVCEESSKVVRFGLEFVLEIRPTKLKHAKGVRSSRCVAGKKRASISALSFDSR